LGLSRHTSGMDLAAKLQLKRGQRLEATLAPQSIAPDLDAINPTAASAEEPALLVFVADRSTLEEQRTQIVAAAASDRLTWVAYPKSGQLGTDLNRDSLAALLSTSGIQPVRQVAIDEVWSALRFRPG
jgi:hypothetical protein